MTRWSAVFPLALILSLTSALAGCSSDDRQAQRRASQNALGARPGGAHVSATDDGLRDRTTDTGSRYVDTARPVGGIAVETSPLTGGALVLPYTYAQASTASESEQPVSFMGALPEILPAPALPERGRVPPPPAPPDWP